METVKIAVSLKKPIIDMLDKMVKDNLFPSRSDFIQNALEEKIIKYNNEMSFKKTNLAVELSKLDINYEQEFSEIGFERDSEEWPQY